MMNVQVFNNEEFGQVRTVTIEDEFYFNLKDCCRVLDIKNHKDAASRLNPKGGSYYRPPYKWRRSES